MKVMIDANVFIVSLENPASNSRIILEMMMNRTIESVFSGFLIEEVSDYFRRNYSKNMGWLVSDLIKKMPDVVVIDDGKMRDEIAANKERYGFSEEDVIHFTVAKEFEVDYLVSLNRHFLRKKIDRPMIMNPKEFLERIGIEPITDFE